MRIIHSKDFFVGCLGFLGVPVVILCIHSLPSYLVEKLEQEEERQALMQEEWFNKDSYSSCEENLIGQLYDSNSYKKKSGFVVISNDGEKKIIVWKFRSRNELDGYSFAIGRCDITTKDGGTVATTMLNVK